ncbi:MAG: hypothetical protein IJX46_06985 [Clostridia bacterium]|nr:hypothetical protein [Clostridia bacterium]
MTNKEFYREFGNIDPKMIEAAAPAEKVQKKKKNGWIKWASAAAACLCFVIVGATYLIAGNVGNDAPEIPSIFYPGYTETSSFYYEGDLCANQFTEIIHKGFDEKSITLSIVKKSNDPLTVAFRGWKFNRSNVLINDFSDLIIYVNGEKVDTIPTAPGKYEVKIDYSKFALKCDELDPYMFVSACGYFCLNDEGYKIVGDIDFSDLT